MIRTSIAAATLIIAAPLASLAAREPLPSVSDPTHARSLAAGYKALMLCGALANQPSGHWMRNAGSVEDFELKGVYPEIDPLMSTVTAETVRGPDGKISYVAARAGADGDPQYAVFRKGKGCALAPPDAVERDLSRIFPDMTVVAERTMVISPPPAPGTSPRKLEPLRKALAAGYGAGTRTTALLVSHGGRVVDEGYAPGFGPDTPQRTWSVAKSIAATLVGAAVQRGDAKLTASAGLGSGKDDPLRRITLDHVLRMASGRTSDTAGNRTDALYFGGYAVDETALHGPIAAVPGSTFRYANNDTLAAVKAITPTFAAHPPAEMFAALGMHNTVAETDWKGDYVLSSQVWSTARDLARLGNLYLQKGKWGGKRILPKDWLATVSRPSGPQPPGEFGYGAGFWLFNKSPGIPPDTIAMQGNRGQYVVIVPSRDMVLVRRGEDPAGARFDIAAFVRDVLGVTGS